MKKLMSIFVFVVIVIVSFTAISTITQNSNNNINEEYKKYSENNYGYPEGYKASKLGRNSLSEKEVVIYDIIYHNIENLSSEATIPSTPQASMDKIYGYYLNDTPEHFYIKNISYRVVNGKAVGITFSYLYPPEQISQKKEAIRIEASKVLNVAHTLPNDYEKSKYIYDYIINKTIYDVNGGESIYWIDGVFLDGKAVCQGYGKAYQMLTGFLGMKSTYVRGTSRDINHGWNLVQIDGDYYHVDPTWGDLSVNGKDGVDYTYLHLTDSEILKDHTIDPKKNPPLPEATKIKENYFVKTNSSIKDYKNNRRHITELIKVAIKNGKKNITLKMEDANEVNQIAVDKDFLTNVVFQARDIAFDEGYNGFYFKRLGVVKNEALQTINIIFS